MPVQKVCAKQTGGHQNPPLQKGVNIIGGRQTDRRGRWSLHYICLYYEFLPYNINIFYNPSEFALQTHLPLHRGGYIKESFKATIVQVGLYRALCDSSLYHRELFGNLVG